MGTLREHGTKSGDSKIGFFPGCVDSLDLFLHDVKTNFGEITTSSVKLLDKLGMKPQVLNMKCCGHDVLWQGKKDVFDGLKAYNKKYIRKAVSIPLSQAVPNVIVLFQRIMTWV